LAGQNINLGRQLLSKKKATHYWIAFSYRHAEFISVLIKPGINSG